MYYRFLLEYEAMKLPTVSTGVETAIYSNVISENTYANVNEKPRSVPSQALPAPSFDPLIPCTCPISVSDLGTHVASCHSESNAGFSQQYQVC